MPRSPSHPIRLSILPLLAAAAAACSDGGAEPAGPPPPAAVIAPYAPDTAGGPAAPAGAFVPDEYPLAWRPNGEIVIAHVQRFRAGQRADSTCRGSGFYTIRGLRARPIATGDPACTGAFSRVAAVDAKGRTAIYPAANDMARLPALIRHPLQVWYTDTIVTGCAARFTRLAVSPDLEQLAAVGPCTEGGTGPVSLHLMAGNGGGMRPVLGEEFGVIGHVSWAPDATGLVFDQRKPRRRPEVNRIVPGHNKLIKLADGTYPAWSPAGNWIAFVAEKRGRTEIRRVRTNGWLSRLVYRAAPGESPPDGPLVWSPDGESLLFTRASPRGTTVWRVDLDTRTAVPVTGRDSTQGGR